MEIRLTYMDAVRSTRWMLEQASHGSTVHVTRPGEDREVVLISATEYHRLVAFSMPLGATA
jgi:hypothetical protein